MMLSEAPGAGSGRNLGVTGSLWEGTLPPWAAYGPQGLCSHSPH